MTRLAIVRAALILAAAIGLWAFILGAAWALGKLVPQP